VPRPGPGSGGPPFLEPGLGPGPRRAREDPEAGARQPAGEFSSPGGDDRLPGGGGVADQGGGALRLQAVPLVGDGRAGQAGDRGVPLGSGRDRGPDAADDGAPQVHDRGEQQGPGVLAWGRRLEEWVPGLGVEGRLEGGWDHDADRGFSGKLLEDRVEEHGRRLTGK
jgi:hypothetical protein